MLVQDLCKIFELPQLFVSWCLDGWGHASRPRGRPLLLERSASNAARIRDEHVETSLLRTERSDATRMGRPWHRDSNGARRVCMGFPSKEAGHAAAAGPGHAVVAALSASRYSSICGTSTLNDRSCYAKELIQSHRKTDRASVWQIILLYCNSLHRKL